MSEAIVEVIGWQYSCKACHNVFMEGNGALTVCPKCGAGATPPKEEKQAPEPAPVAKEVKVTDAVAMEEPKAAKKK